MKEFNELLQRVLAEGDTEQLEAMVEEGRAEIEARNRQWMAKAGGALPDPKHDIHTFASGASSSGRKPNYVGCMPLYAMERFARHRGYGDDKYGEDNYMKGVTDRAFILDRINHGIEHLKILGDQVKRGDVGNMVPGLDDAAAVMCAGMFVMCWQEANRNKYNQQGVMPTLDRKV